MEFEVGRALLACYWRHWMFGILPVSHPPKGPRDVRREGLVYCIGPFRFAWRPRT